MVSVAACDLKGLGKHHVVYIYISPFVFKLN